MSFSIIRAAIVACVLNAAGFTEAAVGVVVGDFKLPDAYGQERALSDFRHADAVVVVFLGVECPLAKLYGPRLVSLASEYADRNVAVIGVNANRQDSLTELAAYGRKHGIEFPLLKDNRAEAVKRFGATRTPEAFVLDRDRVIRYQGRVDDQYDVGVARKAPTQNFVRDALDAVLAGEDVSTPATRAVGCAIGLPREADADAAVTYSEHVAPILERHCVECHRHGEIAPFALRGYDEVAGWADMIAEVVRDQRMPPWHADPAHGEFANARRLSDSEKQSLYDWAEAGAPAGDPAKLPEPRRFVEGWRLPREPDVVVAMRDEPYRVAAQGVIDYQYFVVDPGFTEEKWVQAADITPGDASVVHHVIVFVSPPANHLQQGQPQQGLGWMAAYVPGQSSMTLSEGRARRVPAGSKFIFQMHYTPTGAAAEDRTQMGLVFADPATVEEEVVTLEAANHRFEIPPGDPDYHVSASRGRFPANAQLIGVAPHMHFRGKSFLVKGVQPGGAESVLLNVPRYDFNWQTSYEFAKPIAIPTGYRIDCEASFDNSDQNPANPDPTATVRWGDQSFEEMMIGFFEVAAPLGSLRPEDHIEDAKAGRRMETLAYAQRLFEKHDDGDGKLRREELPEDFAFDRFDQNKDNVLSGKEVFEAALTEASR